MIIGIGTDVVDILRIKEMLGRYEGRSEARLFTGTEIDYCRRSHRPWESFAARFAAKEALFKALGTGRIGRMTWKDVEVLREDGAPYIRLHNETREVAESRGVGNIHLSLSHAGTVACAFVVLERKV